MLTGPRSVVEELQPLAIFLFPEYHFPDILLKGVMYRNFHDRYHFENTTPGMNLSQYMGNNYREEII